MAATYKELNKVNENFIKNNILKAKYIVQVRAILEAGQTYRVFTQGVEQDDETLRNIGRCDSMKVVINLSPAKEKAKECQ